MISISEIRESKKVIEYLEKRQLLDQYKKSKKMLLSWHLWKIDFKRRMPRNKWLWSFRINRQYRIFARVEWQTLLVVWVDNHQNY